MTQNLEGKMSEIILTITKSDGEVIEVLRVEPHFVKHENLSAIELSNEVVQQLGFRFKTILLDPITKQPLDGEDTEALDTIELRAS
jgi:hypothetical protein